MKAQNTQLHFTCKWAHTIYISFAYYADGYHLTFENLGEGIYGPDKRSRHPVEDKKILPLERVVPNSKKEALVNYVAELFMIAIKKLPGSDYSICPDGQERKEKAKEYNDAKEKKLAIIYNDTGDLLQAPVSQAPQSALPKQEAGTCAVTSHQVGFLLRNGEEFYQWMVAEEKRCIVQVGRNEGAKRASEDSFWEIENRVVFEKNEDALCCPYDIDQVMKLVLGLMPPSLLSALNQSNKPLFEGMQLSCQFPSNYKILGNLEKQFQGLNLGPQSSDELSSFVSLLKCFYASVCLKLAIQEENGLKAFMLFEKACRLYTEITIIEIVDKVQFFISYLRALSRFFMQDLEGAGFDYTRCLDVIQGMQSQLSYDPQLRAEQLARLRGHQENVYLSLGFLHYAGDELVDAECCFEKTVRIISEEIRGGVRLIHSSPIHSYPPPRARLGLALAHFKKCFEAEYPDVTARVKTLSIILGWCSQCQDSTDRAIFRRADTLRKEVYKKMSPLVSPQKVIHTEPSQAAAADAPMDVEPDQGRAVAKREGDPIETPVMSFRATHEALSN